MPQVQFQRVKQKQIPVQRVQKKIEISQLQLVQETMRSEVGRMTLENTYEGQDTLNQAARAWNIECLRCEIRDIISPASIEQAMEMQAEAERRKREGDQQSKISLGQRRPTRLGQCCTTFISSRSRLTGSTEAEAHTRPTKTAKTKEAKDFDKSEAEMVDVMDTLQRVISIIEKEMAQNLTFLQKEFDTRNTNNVTAALIRMKTSMSRAFSEQCQ